MTPNDEGRMNGRDPARLHVRAQPADRRTAPAKGCAAVLQLQNVALTYVDSSGESVEALTGVDLDVRDNEFLVVLGPSGCGKSTLLKVMVGLLRPSDGRVLHRGRDLEDTLQDVGMVYQNPLLLPWRSVLDNVLLPVEILRWDRKEFEPKARKILDMVGLSAFVNKMPRQLSGGMQQRVGLCRALITDPTLLLMDEPFAALDALTRDEMARELAHLWEQSTKTVVFVTHSIPEAVLLADRIIVMSPRPGRIARTIVVDLSRPRSDGRKLGAAFEEYVESIRETIFGFKKT